MNLQVQNQGVTGGYLPLAGGTLSGLLTVNSPTTITNADAGTPYSLNVLPAQGTFSQGINGVGLQATTPGTGTGTPPPTLAPIEMESSVLYLNTGAGTSNNVGGNVGIGTNASNFLSPGSTSQIGTILQIGQNVGFGLPTSSAVFVGQYNNAGNPNPQFIGNWASDQFWGIGPANNQFTKPTGSCQCPPDKILKIGRVDNTNLNWKKNNDGSDDGQLVLSIDGQLRVNNTIAPPPVNSSQLEFFYNQASNTGSIQSTTWGSASTNTPTSYNNLSLNNYLNINGNTGVTIGTSTAPGTLVINSGSTGGSGLQFTNLNASSSASTSTPQALLAVDNQGNVVSVGAVSGSYLPLGGGTLTGALSIGNSSSTFSGFNGMLAVDGTIESRKVKVLATGWADYVFDKSYTLPTLDSVATFIVQNKHLPDVPSAATVAKEGLDLGGNQAVLLKKIEELTLYMIAMQKKNEDLQKKDEYLQKQIDELKTKK